MIVWESGHLPIPDLPILRANKLATKHWTESSKIKKMWREAGYFWMKQNKLPPCPTDLNIQFTWLEVRRTKQRVDADSASPMCKAFIDGIVDSGWLEDDSFMFLPRVVFEMHPKDTVFGGTVLLPGFYGQISFYQN